MFVVADPTVDIAPRAAGRFANLAHGTWLAEVSETSYTQGIAGLLQVGPAEPVAAKPVGVSFLELVYRGEVMMVGVRWEATGATGGLLSVLDTNISICPAEQTSTAFTSPSLGTPLKEWAPACALSRSRKCPGCGPVNR
jgi:hypothetical protein